MIKITIGVLVFTVVALCGGKLTGLYIERDIHDVRRNPLMSEPIRCDECVKINPPYSEPPVVYPEPEPPGEPPVTPPSEPPVEVPAPGTLLLVGLGALLHRWALRRKEPAGSS